LRRASRSCASRVPEDDPLGGSDTGEERFPVVLEMGLGVDLHGEDQTKAAQRAVREAIGRVSLPGLRALVPGGDLANMRVQVTVAVPRPDEVDTAAVKAVLPYGRISVAAVPGGLRAPNGNLAGDGEDHLVCAVALIAVGW
jgi:uncharacterized protein (TIGR02058 family)